VAELADAPDLGSGEKSWGFKSLLPHHIYINKNEIPYGVSFFMCVRHI
jgi:hypothetical protein